MAHCRYERSWGIFFESFDGFLTFSWPVITVTDSWTGRAHIVTRMTSVGAFIKMIKTRCADGLCQVFSTLTGATGSVRRSRRKLHATLPAAVLASLKVRIRNGEPKGVRDLWSFKDKTFLAIDFEWSERNASSCLEMGYAAVRCGHLDAVGTWPPDPEPNYRRGHYIVQEYVDKVHNRHRPTFPWAYAFGESQTVSKAKLPQILQAVISSLLSPDSETQPNNLVLIAHGISGDLKRLQEMNIKLPNNVLIIDTAIFERQLFVTGQRGPMQDASGKPREHGSLLSLTNLLQSLGVDIQCTMHNSGNDAFMCLLAFQLLLDRENTKIPSTRGRGTHGRPNMQRVVSSSPSMLPQIAFMPTPPLMYPIGASPQSSLGVPSPRTPDGYFDHDSVRSVGYAQAVSMNGRMPGKRLNTVGSQRPRTVSSGSPGDLVDEMGKMTMRNGP